MEFEAHIQQRVSLGVRVLVAGLAFATGIELQAGTPLSESEIGIAWAGWLVLWSAVQSWGLLLERTKRPQDTAPAKAQPATDETDAEFEAGAPARVISERAPRVVFDRRKPLRQGHGVRRFAPSPAAPADEEPEKLRRLVARHLNQRPKAGLGLLAEFLGDGVRMSSSDTEDAAREQVIEGVRNMSSTAIEKLAVRLGIEHSASAAQSWGRP